MATSNKNLYLTDDERKIIQRGIENNSSKKSIADTLGKDKSTIGKEIKNHRTLSYKSKYPVECVDTGKCPNKYSHHCSMDCPAFKPTTNCRNIKSPDVLTNEYQSLSETVRKLKKQSGNTNLLP